MRYILITLSQVVLYRDMLKWFTDATDDKFSENNNIFLWRSASVWVMGWCGIVDELLALLFGLRQYELHLTNAIFKYIFMPPPLGAGGIMFSGCPSVRPSVRSLKYPLLTCTWVCWSTRPTVTVLRHVRPSVRPSGEVSGHLPENA